MKKPIKLDAYTPEEERANVLTHFPGVVFGIIGVYLALSSNAANYQAWSVAVFFLTCIVLYASSTLYHLVKAKKQKLLFKKLDHISIYLLIAGTFTPFCWGVLGNEAIGKNLLIAVWAIAALGTIFKIFFTGRFEFISLLSYLSMGWLGYLMFGRLGEVMGNQAVNYMLCGGLCYTGGVAFYLMRKLKYHHAIWHIFVLGGSAFHAVAILQVLDFTRA